MKKLNLIFIGINFLGWVRKTWLIIVAILGLKKIEFVLCF